MLAGCCCWGEAGKTTRESSESSFTAGAGQAAGRRLEDVVAGVGGDNRVIADGKLRPVQRGSVSLHSAKPTNEPSASILKLPDGMKVDGVVAVAVTCIFTGVQRRGRYVERERERRRAGSRGSREKDVDSTILGIEKEKIGRTIAVDVRGGEVGPVA